MTTALGPMDSWAAYWGKMKRVVANYGVACLSVFVALEIACWHKGLEHMDLEMLGGKK